MHTYWLPKTILALLAALCVSLPLHSQQADSLRSILPAAESDEERFRLYSHIASYYIYNQTDSALILLDKAATFRSPSCAPDQQALFFRWKGLALKQKARYEQALLCIDSSLAFFRLAGDSIQVAKTLVNKGAYYQQQDQQNEALRYFRQAEQLLNQAPGAEHEVARAKVLNNLSIIYINWGMHAEATDMLFEAIAIKEKHQKYGSLANSYGTLASVYLAREEAEQALAYHQKAAEAAKRSGNRYLEAAFLFNLGSNHQDLKQLEQAEDITLQAKAIAEELENEYLLGHCAIGLAEIARERGQLASAKRQLRQSLGTDALRRSPYMTANAHLILAEIALEEGRFAEAQQLATQSLAAAEEMEDLPLSNRAHELLSKAFEKDGQASTALFHYKKYKQSQDSILSRENTERISQLQAQYDYQLTQKDYELQLADAESELERAANQAQRWYVLFVSLALLVLGGIVAVLAYFNRRHRRTQAELNEMNEELYDSNEKLEIAYLDTISTKQQLEVANHKLQQFVYAASNDLRESIRNIHSFSQLLQRKPGIAAEEELKFIENNSQRMDKLLDSLLRYHELPEGQFSQVHVNLTQVLQQVRNRFARYTESLNARVLADQPLPVVEADRMLMEQLFFHLIGNALKYRHPEQQPEVRLSIRHEPGRKVFVVRDNGIGIPKEHRDAIFQPFFRLHERDYSGSGMGLAICQRIVHTYGGEIWVDRQSNGHGTTLCFTLPKAFEPDKAAAANAADTPQHDLPAASS